MPPAGTSDQSDSVVRVASSFEHNCASVIDRLAVFDGLMEEAADDAAIMPHLARFRQQGCLMTQHRPVFPSVTRWVAPRDRIVGTRARCLAHSQAMAQNT